MSEFDDPPRRDAASENQPASPAQPAAPPARRARFQRQAIGGLLGAAALLGAGQLWSRAGGT